MPLDVSIFKNPPSSYRGVPFYSVNDLLYPQIVRRHIALLGEAGFGGVFFHAREGLVTPFLSNEWFEAFKAALEEAKARGLTVWIYDEDRWPSGFASGLIPAESSKHRPRALLLVVDNKAYSGEEVIATFKCIQDEKSQLPVKCERIDRAESSSNYVYLSFFKYVATTGDSWFQGFSYIDLLNPEAVKRFIEVAYEPYIKLFKEDIGKSIPGVFTDEPNIHDSRPRFPPWWKRLTLPPRGMRLPIYALPWTDGFEELFMKVNGYSIIDKLPELFFDIGDYIKTRLDYWKTITKLFVESFTKQLYEWCDRHGLSLTGHFLAEDDLISQLVVGSVMPHYEYMQIPGIDHLGLQIWGSLLTAKQVSSVANQLSRKRVLCETYGCTGIYASFEDRKWIGDFLYALGVNMLNHHLVLYSIRGRRKADYGLLIHWGQPWWPFNRYIEDYYARLSYVLSEGARLVEVLVLHPMYSVWSTYTPVNESTARQINTKYLELLRELIKLHIDFELGDEMLIEKYGSVESGKFVIGRAKYAYVIMPPMINVGGKTLELLKKFTESGGLVIAVERLPSYVDGVKRDVESELKAMVVKDYRELREVIQRLDLSIVVNTDDTEGDVLLHARRVDEELVIFVTNVSRKSKREVEIGVKGLYEVEEWDAFSGEVKKTSTTWRDGRTWIKTTLQPVRSKLYVLRPTSTQQPLTTESVSLELKRSIKLTKWLISEKGPNYLVLDYARVFIEDRGDWSASMPLPKIKDEYFATNIGKTFKLKFELNVEEPPVGDLELIVEKTSSLINLSINGFVVDLEKPVGEWIDPAFKVYRVPSDMIKRGLNEVVVEMVSSLEPEVEPIYLRGEFGVVLKDKTPVVTKPVIEIEGAGVDLTRNGYPFYSGRVALQAEVVIEREPSERVVLALRGLSVPLALVRVNGVDCGMTIYTDSEIDITHCIRDGVNRVEVELITSLRNTLGPLHREDPVWTGPETFYVVDHTWREHYVVRPVGFEEARIDVYIEKR